jgi:hypothetical protein
MIRKILCWLGFHNWDNIIYINTETGLSKKGKAFCKHCGKMKD